MRPVEIALTYRESFESPGVYIEFVPETIGELSSDTMLRYVIQHVIDPDPRLRMLRGRVSRRHVCLQINRRKRDVLEIYAHVEDLERRKWRYPYPGDLEYLPEHIDKVEIIHILGKRNHPR